MPAPINPNTSAATDAKRRRGDWTAARRLSDHGWLPIPPDVLAGLDADTMSGLRAQYDEAERHAEAEEVERVARRWRRSREADPTE